MPTHYLNAIARPGSSALEDRHKALLCKLPDVSGEAVWLAPGEALELACAPANEAIAVDLLAMARLALAELPVDVNLIPAPGRRKQLLIADMDSTIIEQECIDQIADMAGVGALVAAITERTMRGELEFEAALRERVLLLKGLDEAVLQRVIGERISLTPGARILVQTMKSHGAYCALISGGFSFFTSRIAAMVGFDRNEANQLLTCDGRLTGAVGEPILGREAKLRALQRLTHERALQPTATMAVGDGANDLAMIQAAGLGVAFHAKPIVAREAAARVDHGDLTALLYLQGFARADWVTA